MQYLRGLRKHANRTSHNVESTWMGLETSLALLLIPVGLARSSGLHRVTDFRDLQPHMCGRGQDRVGRQQSDTTFTGLSRPQGADAAQGDEPKQSAVGCCPQGPPHFKTSWSADAPGAPPNVVAF